MKYRNESPPTHEEYINRRRGYDRSKDHFYHGRWSHDVPYIEVFIRSWEGQNGVPLRAFTLQTLARSAMNIVSAENAAVVAASAGKDTEIFEEDKRVFEERVADIALHSIARRVDEEMLATLRVNSAESRVPDAEELDIYNWLDSEMRLSDDYPVESSPLDEFIYEYMYE